MGMIKTGSRGPPSSRNEAVRDFVIGRPVPRVLEPSHLICLLIPCSRSAEGTDAELGTKKGLIQK